MSGNKTIPDRPCFKDNIISHLRDILNNLYYSMKTCSSCGWMDHPEKGHIKCKMHNKDDIISHLREILWNLNYSTKTCVSCGCLNYREKRICYKSICDRYHLTYGKSAEGTNCELCS